MSNTDTSSRHAAGRVTMRADEALALERLKLLHSLEEELEAWAKKRFWTVLIATTVVGFIGIQAIGYLIVDTTLGNRIEDAAIKAALMKDHADRIQKEGDDVVKKAEDAASRTIAKLEELEQQASRLDARFDRILGEGILTPGGEEEDGRAAKYFPSLTQLHGDIESLRGEIGNIAAKFEEVEVARATTSGARAALNDVIEVKQTARPIKSAKYDEKRQWYQITYEVHIDDDAKTFGDSKVVDLIDRVVYKFDETWFFSNPYRTSVNRSDNFKITFEAWGSTKVIAEVYVYGLERQLIREGLIRFGEEPVFLKHREA